ncbi:shikimate dehydrogenase [Paraferrimonas sp. SM1919]|uniref:shikimate dehydrogenase n=1 Tax=Paraferrimonas sp. SM1919 TaxID=2662263 RepID=UPI0013D833FF|nr:shikimate dehydrogenase [Paraferrimonas sp. SM1919]
MDKYAVFGNPIKQSKSPVIHTQFAKQTNQAMQYEAILAPIDGFEQSLSEFIEAGGQGANITVPFKEQAFLLCDDLSPEAQQAGAVNTIMVKADGSLYGHNTDGLGLVSDLTKSKVQLAGKHILLLGAGGAAKGVLLPLINQKPASITIVNRTQEKAMALADQFKALFSIDVKTIDELDTAYDVVINSTAASLSGQAIELPEASFNAKTVCYDMMYSKEATPFNAWAKTHGMQTIDGLGMLINQAAYSFELWREQMPTTDEIENLLNKELGR